MEVQAPADTANEWCSCHSRFGKLLHKLCRKPPPPRNGAQFPGFGTNWPCGPSGWLVLLLIKASDVETNSGLTSTHKQFWICYICHKQIYGRKQISVRCSNINTRCTLICVYGRSRYLYIVLGRCLYLPYTQIIRTHNSHRHNTTAPLQTLVQAHSPPTPPQPRHTSNTPLVPTGLVRPKPNSLTPLLLYC